MKTFTKEIEALKKIEHTPEELEENSRISERLAEITDRLKSISEQRKQIYVEYNRTYSLATENRLRDKDTELRKEAEALKAEKTNLLFSQGDIFRTITGRKIEAERQKQAEYNEELMQIRYDKMNAVNTFDEKAFKALSAREKELEAMKADSAAKVAEYSAEKPEIEKAVSKLREQIEKETAAEVLKICDQLQAILETRSAEDAMITEIERNYDLSEDEEKKRQKYSAISFGRWEILRALDYIQQHSSNEFNYFRRIAHDE
jgi:hypothetical protein